jgi:hypothetical protein
MVWQQYVDDANEPENEFYNGGGDDCDFFDGDQEEELPPTRMHIEDWITWYSGDLMNMWMSLRQYLSDASISSFILPSATFHEFCEFCYRYSDGTRNSYPS